MANKAKTKETKKRKATGMDFSHIIIDVKNNKFTLKKSKAKTELPLLCKLIITRARQGATLEMILYDAHIPQSKWLPYVAKYKKLRTAINDAAAYHKAFGQTQLLAMAKGKKRHSPVLSKLYYSNFYKINENMVVEDDTTKKKKPYKVITTTVEEKIDFEEELSNLGIESAE